MTEELGMTTVEVLRAARARIEDPARWTQRAGGRAIDGRPVNPLHPDAVCWCAAGALHAAVGGSGALDASDLLDEAAGGEYIAFNDCHSHAEVLELFDEAIARAEGGA